MLWTLIPGFPAPMLIHLCKDDLKVCAAALHKGLQHFSGSITLCGGEGGCEWKKTQQTYAAEWKQQLWLLRRKGPAF